MNLRSLKSPFVLVLVGPPLSGKSTWIRKNFAGKPVTVISRDQLVLDLSGSEDYGVAFQTVNQKLVSSRLEEYMEESAKAGRDVIVDMTNLNSKRRRTTLDHFPENYTKIAVIFPFLSGEEIDQRNLKRQKEENKFIPTHVIKNMTASYQPISRSEGFDRVISLQS